MHSNYDCLCDSTIQSFRQSIRNSGRHLLFFFQLLRLLELYAWQASLINIFPTVQVFARYITVYDVHVYTRIKKHVTAGYNHETLVLTD